MLHRTFAWLAAGVLIATTAATAEVHVAEDHRTLSFTCKPGEAVSIAGNANTVRLLGPCGVVTVSGNENRVALLQAQTLATPGSGNVVSWSGNKPVVSDTGSGNQLAGRVLTRGTQHGTVQGTSRSPAEPHP